MLRNWQVLKVAIENDLVSKNGHKIANELKEESKGADPLGHLSDNELVNKLILDAT